MKTDFDNKPKHIACIMDGNGRWAKQQGKPRTFGHRAGADAVSRCIESCIRHGIPMLTLYAFSSENWNRPSLEVKALMSLLHHFLKEKVSSLEKQDIRLSTIGNTAKLPAKTQQLLNRVVEQTKDNKTLHLVLALSYGSRDEIVEATKKIAHMAQSGQLNPEQITHELFEKYLDTAGMPDPDLLIRTSGEMRISNFLLWQISYTELFVTPTLWPDFSEKEFLEALTDYNTRHRKFGKI